MTGKSYLQAENLENGIEINKCARIYVDQVCNLEPKSWTKFWDQNLSFPIVSRQNALWGTPLNF